jgi:hypothetical protein
VDVGTFGNAKRLTRTHVFGLLGAQLAPAIQGLIFDSRSSMPFMAHCSAVFPLQFESVWPIDPVVSKMMAIFHGFGPLGAAVAMALTVSVETPKSFMKYVGTLADSFTLTVFGTLPEAEHDVVGISALMQGVVTVVVTVPKPATWLAPPDEALYASASATTADDAALTVLTLVYRSDTAASAAALAAPWS